MIRSAVIDDLDFLDRLEKTTFSVRTQSTRRSLRQSIKSPFQEVYIMEVLEEEKVQPIGAAILQIYKKTLRIYSISVLPSYQGDGYGRELMEHIFNVARSYKCIRVTLEADGNNEKLIRWYNSFGFTIAKTIEDYYDKGIPAFKMILNLEEENFSKNLLRIKNIVVVDRPVKWLENIESIEIIQAKDYITDSNYHHINGRVFNLCNSYKYQSTGYYVSLLASARDHRVIPNVTTIRDFTDKTIVRSISEEINEIIQKTLGNYPDSTLTMRVFFGQIEDRKLSKLAKELYNLFEAPLLEISFVKNDQWILKKIVPFSINSIKENELDNVKEFAEMYFSLKRFNKKRLKNFKYDLAILVDPNEETPPSCSKALQHFKRAGEKVGFYVEFITKKDYHRINEFDALFIRETTGVNNHTYQFSRYAYAEGLVVIDDPWSILRCSNKLYLYEKMKKGKVKMPKSWLLSRGMDNLRQIEEFKYPIVIKQPDSAFSKGVYKVNNRQDLDEKLKELFKSSELIITQEFIKSEFDWRIGILDNRPLYACRYYMAKGHWQIINWNASQADSEGDAETIPINEVPQSVLEVALKAASFIGDGLYGVDLKEVDGEVYLIEVNDNPNIDSGIEDEVLGDELYFEIMSQLYNNIEKVRSIPRLVSN